MALEKEYCYVPERHHNACEVNNKFKLTLLQQNQSGAQQGQTNHYQ